MKLYGKNKLDVTKGSPFYKNRTFKFILPIIKLYGKTFLDIYNSLRKIAVGINDYNIASMDIIYNKHIFILIDVDATQCFDDLLEMIKIHPAYENDYIYSMTYNLHMLVIKIPNDFISTLENFKQGRYSQMYNQDNLDLLFKNDIPKVGKNPIKMVLRKDSAYRPIFEAEIKKHFRIEDVPQVEWDEYDFPIELKEEVFNYRDN